MNQFDVLIRYGRKDKKNYAVDGESEEEAREWALKQAQVKGWDEVEVEVKQK